MTLFRKYYKQANDDIKTNRELIDRIFESEKTSPQRTKIYKYGTMIAAVFVIAFSVAFYENITKYNEPEVVIESDENFTYKKADNPPEQNIERNITESTDITGENNNKVIEPDIQASNTEMFSVASLVDEKEVRAFSAEKNDITEVENSSEYSVRFNEFTEISAQESGEISEALIKKFGEADADTGNEFIFEIVGAAETEDGKYYGHIFLC